MGSSQITTEQVADHHVTNDCCIRHGGVERDSSPARPCRLRVTHSFDELQPGYGERRMRFTAFTIKNTIHAKIMNCTNCVMNAPYANTAAPAARASASEA